MLSCQCVLGVDWMYARVEGACSRGGVGVGGEKGGVYWEGGGARSASMSYVDLYFHESFQKVSGDGEPLLFTY